MEQVRSALRMVLVAGAFLAGTLSLAQPSSAADTLFWTDLQNQEVMSMPLDGSSAPVALDIAPAQVSADGQSVDPGSLDYDPETGRLYWPNAGLPGNISWARADGSGGGQLDVTGAPINPPTGLSLDGDGDLLYLVGGDGQSVGTMALDGTQGTWALNDDDFRGGPLVDAQGGTLWLVGPEWVSWGDLDGTGTLDTYEPAAFISGALSVDRDAGRLYGGWYPGAGDPDTLAWMATDASADGSLTPTAVDVVAPSATAIDHETGEIYWLNATPYGENADTRGLFKMPLAGGAGSQVMGSGIGGRSGGLVILKRPEASAVPPVLRTAKVGDTLTCGPATWAGDRPEAHYFRSPVSQETAWTRNDQVIPGAAGDTVEADQAGVYECVRTGTNAAGSASIATSTFQVEAPAPPPPPDPVCPAVRIGVGVSKFTPKKPYGMKNIPGIRVTFKTRGNVVVSLRPKITFHGKEGSRVGQLRKHQFKVRGRQRIRFILPDALRDQIAKERGEVRFAPVTFTARATVWQPGARDCAQKRNLKLKTRVYYVSKRVGLRKLW